ncbi:hypothetical protein CK203_004959 [Vitis vinifera]|uniref:Uncharacterized protein n=1 Tax=Vitis vinifera TaxID=29760 RepID=A0A438KEI9_VITVI|nr:hypothetical protein CK203_004959 [Vitis vinifera]
MKVKIQDMETENDKVAKKDFFDLLDISTEVGVDVYEYYLKKFILIVLAKTQEIHFYKELLNHQTLLSPLLTPRVLNIVADLVLLVLPLSVMMVQEERGPMMVDTLEMMEMILDNNNKADNH